jgi:hypothetical protein
VKLLIELAKIANLKRVSKIDIFDAHSVRSKSSKFNAFYEAMLSDRFRTDRDAAKALYDTTPADDRYRQLKSRFRRRLLNTVFFLNAHTPIKPRYEQAFADCQRDLALVHILQIYDAEYTVPFLCRQVLNVAQRHHFTEIILSAVHVLMEVAVKEGDLKEFQRLRAIQESHHPLLVAESAAMAIYQELTLLQRSRAAEQEESMEWDTRRDRLIHLSEQFPTPLTRYLSYLVGAMQYLDQEQHEIALMIAREALQLIEAQPEKFPNEYVLRIRYLLMQAYYHTGQFSQAAALAESGLADMEAGSEDWLGFMDIYYLISLRTENLTQAFAILQRVLQHPLFSKWDVAIKDRWKLYQTALYYLASITPGMSRLKASKVFSDFSVKQFLDDPALFPRERRIFTIWTLVFQLLFYLESKELQRVWEIAERLKHYTRKQLHPVRHERVIEFIRCLGQITKAEMDPDKIRFNNKYYLRLLSIPHRYHGLDEQLEILPFTTLWALLHKRMQHLNLGRTPSS